VTEREREREREGERERDREGGSEERKTSMDFEIDDTLPKAVSGEGEGIIFNS
jgi:hypothetical protein